MGPARLLAACDRFRARRRSARPRRGLQRRSTGGDRLDAIFSEWQPGHGTHVERCRLFSFDLTVFPRSIDANTPLLNLAPQALLSELTADYLHALLCTAALHAFAVENEARMEAMAAARNQIERQLSALRATQRLVRQEEITAEIIELAAGETAARRRRSPRAKGSY
jgi:F-type H+-transporting ATPase subunit gamma